MEPLVLPIPNKFIYKLRLSDFSKALSKLLNRKIFSNSLLSHFSVSSYYLHYLLFPKITEKKFNDARELAKQILNNYYNSITYKTSHFLTMLNETLSQIYAIQLTKHFISELEKKKQEYEKNQDNNNAQQLQQFIDSLFAPAQQSKSSQSTQQQATQSSQQKQQSHSSSQPQSISSKQQPQFSQQSQQNQQFDENVLNEINNILKNAAEKAKKDVQNLQNLLSYGWGHEKTPLEILQKIDTLLVKNAQKILKYANTLLHLSFYTKTTSKKWWHGEEFHDYATTKNLLHADYFDAGTSIMYEPLFIIKAVQGWRRKRFKTSSLPSLFIMIDKSGSMEGLKEIWARSVALALLKKAKKVIVSFFDDDIRTIIEDRDKQIETILTLRSSGGTSITTSLSQAIQYITDHKIRNPTIICITDLEAERKEEDYKPIAQMLKKHKIKLITVNIEGVENPGLKSISDKFFSVQPTTDNALKIIQMF